MRSLILAAISLGAQALPDMTSAALVSRGLSSYGSSSSQSSTQSSTSVQSFASSWQKLSEQFHETQAVVQKQSSFSFSYQSVQSLVQACQSAFSQYQACDVCSSGGGLIHSDFEYQFRQTVVEMYSYLQIIISSCQQTYSVEWSEYFFAIFEQMNSFTSLCQNISSVLNIDLGTILSDVALNTDIFGSIGVNLDGILGAGSAVHGVGQGGGDGLLGGSPSARLDNFSPGGGAFRHGRGSGPRA